MALGTTNSHHISLEIYHGPDASFDQPDIYQESRVVAGNGLNQMAISNSTRSEANTLKTLSTGVTLGPSAQHVQSPTSSTRYRRTRSRQSNPLDGDATGLQEQLTGSERIEADLMPTCWKADFMTETRGFFWWFWLLEMLCFQFLCLIAFGKTELRSIWHDVKDEKHFRETTEQLKHQVNNTNIMAGLLLATTAVFLTTDAPRGDMIAFNRDLPYGLLLFSFGMAMGSILGGCTLQLVAGRCTPAFLIEITSTRIRLLITLVLIGYPLFSVAVACNVCALGLLLASLSSSYTYIMAGGILLVVLPWTLFLAFTWLSLAPAKGRIKAQLRSGNRAVNDQSHQLQDLSTLAMSPASLQKFSAAQEGRLDFVI